MALPPAFQLRSGNDLGGHCCGQWRDGSGLQWTADTALLSDGKQRVHLAQAQIPQCNARNWLLQTLPYIYKEIVDEVSSLKSLVVNSPRPLSSFIEEVFKDLLPSIIIAHDTLTELTMYLKILTLFQIGKLPPPLPLKQ